MNIHKDICNKKTVIEKVTGFFTSEDIIKVNEFFNTRNKYSLDGLVQYFDGKLGCNRVAKILNDVIQRGIKLTPNIVFHPITEKIKLTNGEFTLSQQPYFMGSSIFINNLIVVKLTNGKYVFHDDVDFNSDNLKCLLSDKTINGTVTVSYFVLDTGYVGGLNNII